MPILDTIGTQALGMMLGDTWGKQQDRYQDQRQLEQQRKLQDLQIEGNKQLADYSQELSYDLWKRTNYSAQRAEMEKAGLNIGLMYAKGGPGGTTGTASAGSASGTMAGTPENNRGMGMQLALATALQQAQIENIKADTEKKKVEAGKTAGADTDLVKTTIEQVKQSINNAQATEALTKVETSIKELELAEYDTTFTDRVMGVKANVAQSVQILDTLRRENKINDETYKEKVQTIVNTAQLGTAQIQLAKAQLLNVNADTAQKKQATQKLVAEIDRIYADKWQEWEKLKQSEREVFVKETLARLQGAQTEFNTSTPQQIKQWVEVFTNIITLGATGKGTNLDPVSFIK